MIGGLKVLALVTARGGSKGLPGKNILPVRGRPLIQWTIDAARASRYIDRLILSCDDPGIIDIAVAAGCEAPFRRDAALATDTATSVDVALDALDRVPNYEVLLLLQPTSPLRTAADIDGALDLFAARGAPACTGVRLAEDHPYWTYRCDPDGRLTPFAVPAEGQAQRRQDLPAAWRINGALYIVRVDEFRRSRSFLPAGVIAFSMPADRSIDIDTIDDVERMNALLDARDTADPPAN